MRYSYKYKDMLYVLKHEGLGGIGRSRNQCMQSFLLSVNVQDLRTKLSILKMAITLLCCLPCIDGNTLKHKRLVKRLRESAPNAASFPTIVALSSGRGPSLSDATTAFL